MVLLDSLNETQAKAVTHIHGPMLVVAGAGSGKTRVVTFRIAYLLHQGISSDSIVALTFTNKAAEEMRHRVSEIAEGTVLTCTFHSLCAQILRESISPLGFSPDFVIFDQEDCKKLIKQCLSDLEIKADKTQIKNFHSIISRIKNDLHNPDSLQEKAPQEYDVYQAYQQALKRYNALDFDDLLLHTVTLFRQEPSVLAVYSKVFQFILVDEYQDTNNSQYTLLKLLLQEHNNLFAVGDPDQSIYSWRGANIDNILSFQKDFPNAKTVYLEENYRSSKNILKAADALIQNNQNRLPKILRPVKHDGSPIRIHIAAQDHSEALFVAKEIQTLKNQFNFSYNSFVIFYRTHAQSRAFEDVLIQNQIPHTILGGISFYMRREIKDVVALFRILLNNRDFVAFSRSLQMLTQGFGETTLARIHTFSLNHTDGDLLEALHSILKNEATFSFRKNQINHVLKYLDIIEKLEELLFEEISIANVLEQGIFIMEYDKILALDPQSFEERKNNLEALVNKAVEWEEELESRSSTSSKTHTKESGDFGVMPKNGNIRLFFDEMYLNMHAHQKENDSVKLMTLHNGKGLEFSVCFLTGLEENLFPYKSSHDLVQEEEERRLCYVGMTRSKEHLYMTGCQSRYQWGGVQNTTPSRFLSEIPKQYAHITHEERSKFVPMNNTPKNSELDSKFLFTTNNQVFHSMYGAGIIQKALVSSSGNAYEVYFFDLKRKETIKETFLQKIS